MKYLTFTVSGLNRKELQEEAAAIAEKYYGHKCLQIVLTDEEVSGKLQALGGKTVGATFTAKASAKEHRPEVGKAGLICKVCGTKVKTGDSSFE